MKKILAIALALVLVLSMGMVALAEDPVLGSIENPNQVANPMQAPSMVTVEAGQTVWYAYSSNFFNNYELTTTQGLDAVIVDGEWFYPTMQLRGGIKASLTASAMMIMVGFVNNTEEAVTVEVSYSEMAPGATKDTAAELSEGTAEYIIEIQEFWFVYTSYEFDGALSIAIDADSDAYEVAAFDGYFADMPVATAMPDADGKVELSLNVETYSPVFVCVRLYAPIACEVTTTLAVPELGSEANPIQIWSVEDLDDLVIPQGASLYIALYGFGGNTLYTSDELTFEVGGEDAGKAVELDADEYTTVVKVTNVMDYDVTYAMWVEFPLGSENCPEYIEYGETVKVETSGENSYYYEYYAYGDGTVTVKLDDISTISGLEVMNTTVIMDEDYDYSDYELYFDYMEKHADKDADGNTVYDEETWLPVYSSSSQYYATVKVNKGDTVKITVIAKTDDEWLPVDMNAEMTIDAPEAPVGAYENPAEFKDGKNEFTVLAEDYVYVGTWVAPADGLLSVTVVGDVMEFAMGDEEGEDAVYMSEGDELKLKVKKGQTIIMISLPGLDENDEFVDTDVALTIDFEADEVEENDSPATGATGAGVAVLLTLISGAGLAVLNKKRNA